MTDEQKTDEQKSGNGDDSGAKQEPKSKKSKMRDGIKEGIGVLSAFRDALEETINEARERGDLSADRAKEVMKETLDKAQTAAEGARERLDFATQADMESVKSAVDSIKERVSALEESVFGAPKGDEPSVDDAGAATGESEDEDSSSAESGGAESS